MCRFRFVTQNDAPNVLDEHFSIEKKLRGFYWASFAALSLEQSYDHRKSTSRSTFFFSDKQDFETVGLWPPSAVLLSFQGCGFLLWKNCFQTKLFLMPRVPSESPVFADCRDPRPHLRRSPDRGITETTHANNLARSARRVRDRFSVRRVRKLGASTH